MQSISRNKNKKVALALSGGVDSAVSAALLKNQGYDVVCIHMVCWEDLGPGCSSDKNRVDAAKVAGSLDLPLLVWDFTKEYKKEVIDYFYAEYEAGRTPNPDVMCNKEIKFGLFLDKALEDLKVDFIATGHYARIIKDEESKEFCLSCGKDLSKDQSYFLYLLTSDKLSKILFPIGDYTKTQVRKMAKDLKLPVWDKPDSQGICFIGEIDVRKFLEERIKPRAGKVLNMEKEVIGEHEGAWFYTVGQRHGFKLYAGKGFTGGYNPQPLYVLSKNTKENTITVGAREDAMCSVFKMVSKNLDIAEIQEVGYSDLSVRIRHLGDFYPVKEIEFSGKKMKIILSKKAFGIAPGQSAVFYRKEVVLGGGEIIDDYSA